MTGKNCQNCKKAIGYLEEFYSYYGQPVCKECMIKLEKLFGGTGTNDDDIEAETLITEKRIEQEQEKQATTDFNKDAESINDKTSLGKDIIPKGIYNTVKKLKFIIQCENIS